MESPSRPELVRDTQDVLHELLARVEARTSEQASSSNLTDVGDVKAELVILASVMEEMLAGMPASEACAPLLRPELDIRLARELQRELLLSSPSDYQAGASMELLRVLERLTEALRPLDPTDLRGRLTEPDAFELLVEVAHDLRSPLTSILFLSETLRVGHSGEVNEVQRSQLGLIYSAALGLTSVSSNIVDFARGGRGLTDADIEPYSISEVFDGVEQMAGPMAEEKGVEFRIEKPSYDRASGHRVALARVLLNLVTNALKFTDQGHVELGAIRSSQSSTEYYVRDTGRGISPEAQKVLFQPFKKADHREGHFFSGSGLGLSIVRKLLRAMGSDLRLETRPDWGTRFHFVLADTIPPAVEDSATPE